jgi:hypothetical protein
MTRDEATSSSDPNIPLQLRLRHLAVYRDLRWRFRNWTSMEGAWHDVIFIASRM